MRKIHQVKKLRITRRKKQKSETQYVMAKNSKNKLIERAVDNVFASANG